MFFLKEKSNYQTEKDAVVTTKMCWLAVGFKTFVIQPPEKSHKSIILLEKENNAVNDVTTTPRYTS